MKKKKRKKTGSWIWKALLKIVLCLFCFTIVQVLSLKFINPIFTPNVAWEWAESIIKKQPERRPNYIFKKIEFISPHLRKAVIAAEDQRFLSHNGFDFKEIRNVLKTLIKRKKIRGASTISMQAARSVFLLSSKSVFRKIAEVYYTVLIELFWDKHRILEIYLNTVDWGTGVTGAEAASQKYFSKSAQHLSSSQAALMTAILPNPHIWSVKNPSPYIKERQAKIMKDMALMPQI
ncbi:MAG: monofunctional biosynthetic peptidoglycan transglycosylase [Desulfobacula sp.]|mgnify:FL=1|jgi:monofunctional biosynthetic peptidoglycan transglycosylase|uniref:monofunctional biosynthetic peptidoglycan transglycosylase n=1 Tax=Desulfobacula sp. TaxID=2593537 RepID=UPI001DD5F63D|nr:monofunctional biosynthetic peptidoglycan transglycosylase [Desulfobacula sp.]MBT3484470.1 monofunctional biosynthetic peptidoglycan transglycosylase [Desulfobacula sp.]MBT3803108.1 monofunctional biosynthetic peptidoglycan transglycosylase [Desulfobacula sp.]MBT4024678.1 monofunctional biosynthetic peptidoglycan transglycosylase [Desulfobacula sp.]MBT4197156.1 monofunctional biosynthetic peptidoglycan transglycosylase [Desulfobacula sp.]